MCIKDVSYQRMSAERSGNGAERAVSSSGRIKEKPVGGTTRRGAVGAEGVGSGEGAEPPPQKIFDIFYS